MALFGQVSLTMSLWMSPLWTETLEQCVFSLVYIQSLQNQMILVWHHPNLMIFMYVLFMPSPNYYNLPVIYVINHFCLLCTLLQGTVSYLRLGKADVRLYTCNVSPQWIMSSSTIGEHGLYKTYPLPAIANGPDVYCYIDIFSGEIRLIHPGFFKTPFEVFLSKLDVVYWMIWWS